MRRNDADKSGENNHWGWRTGATLAGRFAFWHIYLEHFGWQLKHFKWNLNNPYCTR
jgi:hypothetical protein